MPTQYKVYDSSRNALHSIKGPKRLGGSLTRAIAIAITALKRMTNPMIRTVHPNPVFGSNCWAINGNIMPPVAAPDAVQAMAKARFVEK